MYPAGKGIIYEGKLHISTTYMVGLDIPRIFLLITVASFNLLGDIYIRS
jgi:hypothetical protein